MNPTDKVELQEELLKLFRVYGLSVAVGLTKHGVTIISQDDKVDARNSGPIEAWEGEGGSVTSDD